MDTRVDFVEDFLVEALGLIPNTSAMTLRTTDRLIVVFLGADFKMILVISTPFSTLKLLIKAKRRPPFLLLLTGFSCRLISMLLANLFAFSGFVS
jgi:hypothetical protein